MVIGLLKKMSSSHLHVTPLKSAKERDSLILAYFKHSDIEFKYVVLDDYCKERNTFTTCWEYNKEKDAFINLYTPCSPDIIRNLCSYHTYAIYHTLKKHTIICSEHVSQLADNKQHTYEFLATFQPESMLLKYFLDDKKAQENFGDEVVLKPIYGNGGIGVELLNTQHILENQKTRRSLGFIYLVQKKIDTTNGYAGITSANHDLRLYYIGNKLVDAVIREKENTGEFKVNVSQGGHARYIDIGKLPNDLSDTAKEIIEEIHPKQKDIFSLDFMYDSNEMKWYLIEMNSNPGFRNINNIEVHEIPLLQAIEEVLRK